MLADVEKWASGLHFDGYKKNLMSLSCPDLNMYVYYSANVTSEKILVQHVNMYKGKYQKLKLHYTSHSFIGHLQSCTMNTNVANSPPMSFVIQHYQGAWNIYKLCVLSQPEDTQSLLT